MEIFIKKARWGWTDIPLRNGWVVLRKDENGIYYLSGSDSYQDAKHSLLVFRRSTLSFDSAIKIIDKIGTYRSGRLLWTCTIL